MCRRRKLSPTAHSFLSCQKRMGRKEALEYEIALTRLKRHFDSAYHSPMARPVRNALRAAVQSGFPSARYTVRVVLFAPVEYLTYGSRKAVFFCKGIHTYRAQTDFRARYIRNRSRVFRLPRRSIKDASVARFASLSLSPHKPNSGDDPRKGAAAPFLVVLRGIVKGENRNSPLTILSFDRQRRFLSHTRKKAGLKTSLF